MSHAIANGLASHPVRRRSVPSKALRPTFACVARQAFSTVVAGGHKVRVSFSIPYRCKFGQHICIVGANEELGSWDVQRGIAMDWSNGDVWQAQLDLETNSQVKLEYKYVVRDDSWYAMDWKPGDNCNLRVDQLMDVIHVSDNWESATSDVQVVPGRSTTKASATSVIREPVTVARPTPVVQKEPKPSVKDTTASRSTQQTLTPKTEQATPVPAEPAIPTEQKHVEAPLTERFIVDEMDIVAQAADRALQELDDTIAQSIELIESLENPTDGEAFAADRMVAAAARKAMALSKALTAADPGYNYRFLKPPKKPVGELDGPSDVSDQP